MEEKYSNRYTRRRRFDLKCGLAILCFAIFTTLSEGHIISDNDFIELWNQNRRSENAPENSAEPNFKNVCLTSECIDTAIRVLMYMDKRIKPCEDFYKFACGNFRHFVEFPTSESNKLDEFTIIETKVKKEMMSILEEESTQTEPRYAKLIKTFYQTCIESTDINRKDIKLISNLLNKIGGWPLLEETFSSYKHFQWEKFGSEQKNVFFKNGFIFSNLRLDTKNNTNLVLQIKQPTSFNTASNYSSLIEATAKLFGADALRIQKDITQIADMEKGLFNISVPAEERTDSRIRMTVKELIGNYSNILWKEYFNTFLKPFNTVKDEDIVLIADDGYFKQFNNFIKHFSKRDQVNYLIWKVVEDFLNNYVGSIENRREKSEKCYDYVNDLFGNSFGMLYIRKHFNSGSITNVTDEMVSNIFEQFNNVLRKADWMDSRTKSMAFEKLRSMTIVHPSIFDSYTDDEIDEYFRNLEITPGDFLQSFLTITEFNKYNDKYEFGRPVNFSSWTQQLTPITVNAMNYVFNNTLILSPAIFQGNFFNENRPQYMNYGSLGYIIGHEFTHAFDNNGKNFDKFGNLVNWWEEESNKEFLSKTKCIVRQYGNYTVKEIDKKVKGERTQNENIADNGGLKVAYFAYEKYMRSNSPESMLPGLDFTQRQLFWISFAQSYCVKTTEEGLKRTILTDFHSPNEFRVIGSISNRPEFARDFQCEKGANMNPENKCSVW